MLKKFTKWEEKAKETPLVASYLLLCRNVGVFLS